MLIKSEGSKPKKFIIGISGFVVALTLLIPATLDLHKTANSNEFDLITTRNVLSIGQSGGLAVINGDDYYTDFTVTANNDCICINNNIYTASKIGVCTLTVAFDDQIRTVDITVDNKANTNKTVYISPTGGRYHISSNHAGDTAIKITEEEALQSGKTPCKICWK